MELRQYFPDKKLIEYASKLFSSHKEMNNKSFLIHKLNEKLSLYPGSYESDEDMKNRYRYALF